MRRPRYRVRSLLVLVAVAAVGLAAIHWSREHSREVRAVVMRLIGPAPIPRGKPMPAWLADALGRRRPPADRRRYFAWLQRPNMGVRIVGWDIGVLDVRPSLGGRVVKIIVRPRLWGGGVPFTSDAFYEVCEYRGGRLRYRGGWGRDPQGVLFID